MLFTPSLLCYLLLLFTPTLKTFENPKETFHGSVQILPSCSPVSSNFAELQSSVSSNFVELQSSVSSNFSKTELLIWMFFYDIFPSFRSCGRLPLFLHNIETIG